MKIKNLSWTDPCNNVLFLVILSFHCSVVISVLGLKTCCLLLLMGIVKFEVSDGHLRDCSNFQKVQIFNCDIIEKFPKKRIITFTKAKNWPRVCMLSWNVYCWPFSSVCWNFRGCLAIQNVQRDLLLWSPTCFCLLSTPIKTPRNHYIENVADYLDSELCFTHPSILVGRVAETAAWTVHVHLLQLFWENLETFLRASSQCGVPRTRLHGGIQNRCPSDLSWLFLRWRSSSCTLSSSSYL